MNKISGVCRFSFATPAAALDCLWKRLAPLETECVSLAGASGRVLAESIVADRPSPACDVSAMDGYALRVGDARGKLPVSFEVITGQTPPPLAAQTAARIFTGGAVPDGAEAVVPRERVVEARDHIVLSDDLCLSIGANIRRRGENADQGAVVVPAGTVVHPGRTAAAAICGVKRARVFRRVRIGLAVTGNEVVAGSEPRAAEVRDANGPALASLLAAVPYAELAVVRHVPDDPARTRDALAALLDACDAVFLTGGVSLGDHDYVTDAVSDVADVLFHGLPVRPGKPILAAVHGENQPILGLPGNPLAVLVGARRFGLEAIRRLAGVASRWTAPAVRLEEHDGRTLGLWWYRPVRRTGDGAAVLERSKGSGDVVSAAASDGFVELPPDAAGPGPWPFYPWGPGG